MSLWAYRPGFESAESFAFCSFQCGGVSTCTLGLRFRNFPVAEAYRALLRLRNPSICGCSGLTLALRRPRALLLRWPVSLRQFRGGCHTLPLKTGDM